jgi:hypothetical protein
LLSGPALPAQLGLDARSMQFMKHGLFAPRSSLSALPTPSIASASTTAVDPTRPVVPPPPPMIGTARSQEPFRIRRVLEHVFFDSLVNSCSFRFFFFFFFFFCSNVVRDALNVSLSSHAPMLQDVPSSSSASSTSVDQPPPSSTVEQNRSAVESMQQAIHNAPLQAPSNAASPRRSTMTRRHVLFGFRSLSFFYIIIEWISGTEPVPAEASTVHDFGIVGARRPHAVRRVISDFVEFVV